MECSRVCPKERCYSGKGQNFRRSVITEIMMMVPNSRKLHVFSFPTFFLNMISREVLMKQVKSVRPGGFSRSSLCVTKEFMGLFPEKGKENHSLRSSACPIRGFLRKSQELDFLQRNLRDCREWGQVALLEAGLFIKEKPGVGGQSVYYKVQLHGLRCR